MVVPFTEMKEHEEGMGFRLGEVDGYKNSVLDVLSLRNPADNQVETKNGQLIYGSGVQTYGEVRLKHIKFRVIGIALGLEDHNLWAKSSYCQTSVDKFYWNMSTLFHLHVVCSCFSGYNSKSYNRLPGLKNLQYFPFMESVPFPGMVDI